MSRITFVYPDFESLGVEYLMAACAAAGHDVELAYYEVEDAYLGRAQKRVSYDRLLDTIERTDPHVVAFSCVTDNFRYQLECARLLKQRRADVFTIFGGVHPTAVPQKTLAHECVDAVAIGEAEDSLIELLEQTARGGPFRPTFPVPGIVFKNDRSLVGEFREGNPPQLDFLPFPRKEAFLPHLGDAAYEYRIITSRGCPYRCSYCFNSQLHKLRGRSLLRRRRVSDVIWELQLAKQRFGVKRVLFLDDSFTTHRRWITEFCEQYKRDIDLPFACLANPDYLNDEVARALAGAGCVNVQIGVQSLSEPLCADVLDRHSNNRQIAETIETLKRHGMMVQVDHMLGIPGDTVANQEASLRFYNTHRPDLISIFWLTYYPKTTIIDKALQTGALTEADVDLIEQGIRLTRNSYLTGGSMRRPRPFYSVSFLMNWLPLLPKFLVHWLVKTRLYRLLPIKNFLLGTALPRVIGSLLNRRDFRGRSHIMRFLGKVLGWKKSPVRPVIAVDSPAEVENPPVEVFSFRLPVIPSPSPVRRDATVKVERKAA